MPPRSSSAHMPQLDGLLRPRDRGGRDPAHDAGFRQSDRRHRRGVAILRALGLPDHRHPAGRQGRGGGARGVSRGRLARLLGPARRALRIFPLYYATLAAMVAFRIGAARAEWPWYAAYLGNARNLLPGREPEGLVHFWSLANEEQFYLLWPPLCLWLSPACLRRLAAACVVVGPAARLVAGEAGAGPIAAALAPLGSLDGLCLGALLAIRRRDDPAWTPPGWAAAVGVATLAAATTQTPWAIAGISFGLALASWWLVGRASIGFGGGGRRLLEARPVMHIGKISYGIYVIHATLPAIAARMRYSRLGTSLGYPAESARRNSSGSRPPRSPWRRCRGATWRRRSTASNAASPTSRGPSSHPDRQVTDARPDRRADLMRRTGHSGIGGSGSTGSQG